MTLKIGFTGTRKGMTEAQKEALRDTLTRIYQGVNQPGRQPQFHHGDCIGADEEAASIADEIGYEIVSHLPENQAARAFFPSDYEMPPLPYIERDHALVEATDLLMAAPDGEEKIRSGTWTTIRYALRHSHRVAIIWPDGRKEKRM